MAELADARVDSRGENWLGSLYAEQYGRLVRLAIQLVDTQESAEDVVQEVFAEMQRRGNSTHENVEKYLTSAVMNRCRSRLRRRASIRRLARVAASEIRRSGATSTSLDDEYAEIDALRGMIRRLPSRQRQVLVLRYYEGMTAAETSDVLGISVTAVTSSLSRALRAMEDSWKRGRND